MEKVKKHFRILLGIYIVVLVWGIILKENRLNGILSDFNRMVNLDLFSRLTYSPLNPFSMRFTTVEYNILNFLAFIPYSFLVSTLSQKASFWRTIIYSFLLSLIFEVSQIFTAIGGFATNDLMINTLGGAVGFVVFAIFDRIRKQCSQKACEKMTMAIVVICYVCFVPLAIYGVAKTIYHLDFYLSLLPQMVESLR